MKCARKYGKYFYKYMFFKLKKEFFRLDDFDVKSFYLIRSKYSVGLSL